MYIQPTAMDVFQIEGNDSLNKCRSNGESRNSLSHYTSLKTLKCILENRMLLLNRIDKVNDLFEKDFLRTKENYMRVFISSFTHNEDESIPQWYMYTPKLEGVRLTFNLKKKLDAGCIGIRDVDKSIRVEFDDKTCLEYKYYNHMRSGIGHCINNESHWDILLSSTDILYKPHSNYDYEAYINGSMTNIAPIGKIKNDDWQFESETRIIGIFRTIRTNEGLQFKVPEHVLIPLDFSKFDLTITLNPWSTQKFEDDVKEICNKFLSAQNYQVKTSKHHKFLRERDW